MNQESGGLHVFEFHGTSGHVKAFLIFILIVATLLMFAYLFKRWHQQSLRWRSRNLPSHSTTVNRCPNPRVDLESGEASSTTSTTRRSNPSILERIVDRLDDSKPTKRDQAILAKLNQMQALQDDIRRDQEFRMSMMEMGFRNAINNNGGNQQLELPHIPPRCSRTTPRIVDLSEL